MSNILLWTDSYNVSHWQMRKDVTKDIAYLYNREAPIILFGLKGLINQLFHGSVHETDVTEAIKHAQSNGLEFDEELWRRLIREHDGKISNVLTIEQLPEFCWYPAGTPIAKIYNHVNGFAELATYFEGYLTKCFYPSACLTNVYRYKELGLKNIHNFGYRGHRTEEDALWSDLAFALVYEGTDSFHINHLIELSKHYRLGDHTVWYPYRDIIADLKPTTIRAASHKIIQCARSETEAIYTIISKNSGKTVAMPIDTYDSENYIREQLRYAIETAYYHGTNIMFRVDSGDKVRLTIEIIRKILEFKKEKMFNNTNPVPIMGVICSGNITADGAESIRRQVMFNIRTKGFNVDNYLFFGVGGSIYNDADRDKIGMVMKLGWSHESGPTMKTTKGKESIPGDFNVMVRNLQEYYISSEKRDEGNVVNEEALELLRDGKVYGKDFKLVLAQDIQETILQFKKDKGVL